MIEHITTFFNSLLGTTLPEVVCLVFALTLVYFLFKGFLKLFNMGSKQLDFAFYSVTIYLLLSNLGGLEWQLLL